MSRKTLNILFIISSGGLALAGLLFVILSIFNKAESGWALPAGLFCVALSNLFNIIRAMAVRKEQEGN